MNISILRSCIVLLVLNLSMIITFPVSAQGKVASPTIENIAFLDGEERLAKLIAGAKKEGELSIYGSIPAEDFQPVLAAFTKKYGVKIKTWRSSSENILQRVVTEAHAGRFDVDLIENNAPEMEALHREKLLQKVSSPFHTKLVPHALPVHKEWVGTSIDMFVQAYNTDKIKKADLPKTYEDLADPKWKGQIGIEVADQHWYAAVLEELGPENGTKLFKKIAATNGISLRKGHALLAKLIASGEVPLGLTLYNYKPEQMKQKGAAIDWFIIPPAIAQFRSVGILRKAPHPHAALLFYDFMLSEGQEILARRDFIPVSTKVQTPFTKTPMRFIDPARFLDLNEKWTREFEETFVKGTK